MLLLLLEIAGIIIAIIAVCTKRTFFPPPFLWGMGMGLSLSLFYLDKITKNIVSKKVLAIKGKTHQCLWKKKKKNKICSFCLPKFSSFVEFFFFLPPNYFSNIRITL